MSIAISHPLDINVRVEATKPRCPCVGGGFTTITGKVLKVIQNHSGVWYYLDSGSTVKSDWVRRVI